MAIFRVFIVIATFCVVCSLQNTLHTKCKKGDPLPTSLKVMGCEESPCLFVRGHDIEAEWNFTAVANTNNLKAIVKAKTLGVTITYPLPENDACKSLINGDCPLKHGELVTYGLKMPIFKSYPKLPLHLTFFLVDENNNVHVCFGLDAKVVSSFY